VITDLGPVVLERRIEFDFEGVRYDQDECFFAVRVSAFEIDTNELEDAETPIDCRAPLVDPR